MKTPELIVMLTEHDFTVANAAALFDACKNSAATMWGLKEKGLPESEMEELFATFKRCGKRSVLEVVAYTEEDGLRGAELAARCHCDILLGTKYYDSIGDFCVKHQLKYMPFIGKVSGRPSILEGSLDEMLAEAEDALKKGVYGFDLLGYRYRGDADALCRQFVSGVNAPVCVAGSIDSYERLDRIIQATPAFFTIGSAFFGHRFGNTFAEQIDRVCNYIAKKSSYLMPIT